MRITTELDSSRDTALISFASSCYTDSLPLVRDVFVANADFGVASNGFLLGCAILIRNYAGEQVEFEGQPIGADYAEAVHIALKATTTVGRVEAKDRTLALGEIDVACFPARHRDIDWPADDAVPLVVADWSGDYVPPGDRRSGEQVIGRYFTNAGLIADETTVSIALGLMAGGNRLRRLLVPVPVGTKRSVYESLVEALAVAGIELVLVPVRAVAPATARGRGSHAVVMLTHNAEDRVLRHFERLRRESAPLMPAYFAFHNPDGEPPAVADIVLRNSDAEALMPRRYGEFVSAGGRIDRGYVDLIATAAGYDPRVRDFDHLWLIEYDVDFSGNWADFFGPLMDNDADLLVSRLQTKAQFPHWYNWTRFRHPADLKEDHRLASFMPASRQSRRFIETYRNEMAGSQWWGHSEATTPSIAAYRGLRIEDMMGTGPYALRGDAPLDNVTYGYRPARSDAYFHEDPARFASEDRLYHPVKAVAQVDGSLVTQEPRQASPLPKAAAGAEPASAPQPDTTPLLDLATVVFEGDVRLAALQVRSVARFAPKEFFRDYHVVLNGADNAALEQELTVTALSGVDPAFRDRVKFIGASDLINARSSSGWRDQQALKLLLSRRTDADLYMVLDAKNHFVRPFERSEWFHEGKPLTSFSRPSPLLERLLRGSMEVFSLKSERLVERAMPTTTPYVIHTKVAQGLLRLLERKFDKPFEAAFRQHLKQATEFYLLYCYLARRKGGVEAHYAEGPARCRTLYTTWPIDERVVDATIAEVYDQELPMFGLHRNRLSQLTDSQRQAIRRLWERHGLVDPRESGWFLTAPVHAERKLVEA